MWGRDLTEHAAQRIRELRPDVEVEVFEGSPKPIGLRLKFPDGQVAYVQATTAAPNGGGTHQTGWPEPARS